MKRTFYYLSYQDGRVDFTDYETREQALRALGLRSEHDQQGICIMSHEKEIPEYDSTADTLKHIRRVQELLGEFAIEMIRRGVAHDASKLGPNEKPHFDRETPMLKELTYGSPEYKESLGRLKDALMHHYKVNSHHPEYHEHGVADMTLFDLVEMFFDWVAASERNKGGKLNLEVSFERFKFDPQLANIFRQTARALSLETVE